MRYPKVIFPHRVSALSGGMIAAALLGLGSHAQAQAFTPGDILVSLSVYQDTGLVSTLQQGSILPDTTKKGAAILATADGKYADVFNNAAADGSFGVTSPILLDEIDPTTGALAEPQINLTQEAANEGLNLVTSFSSKSELALNVSTAGDAVTFMGYDSTVGALDISNSNTPGVADPTNLDSAPATYREVAQLNADGSLNVTTTNAYSGNNGRAAILDDTNGQDQYLTTGNAGNGGSPPPNSIVGAAGAQIVTPGQNATAITPGTTEIGSFSVTQTNPLTGTAYSTTADKPGKDNNYRGETISNNTLYITKGSGGNGINTVYQVGNSGSLPTGSGNAITVLPGFPTMLASSAAANFYPFGLFFANSTTLYVADEGDGTAADAATDAMAGLEKWSLNTTTGIWGLDYTLQDGLGLGQTETVAGMPISGTVYPDPATDGLRNITGKVNADGTVTLYGVTSTVSASGDQGADPNEVVDITDSLADTTAPASGESFNVLEGAQYGGIYRGVSFTPQATAVPEASGFWLLGLGLAPLALIARRRRATI